MILLFPCLLGLAIMIMHYRKKYYNVRSYWHILKYFAYTLIFISCMEYFVSMHTFLNFISLWESYVIVEFAIAIYNFKSTKYIRLMNIALYISNIVVHNHSDAHINYNIMLFAYELFDFIVSYYESAINNLFTIINEELPTHNHNLNNIDEKEKILKIKKNGTYARTVINLVGGLVLFIYYLTVFSTDIYMFLVTCKLIIDLYNIAILYMDHHETYTKFRRSIID